LLKSGHLFAGALYSVSYAYGQAMLEQLPKLCKNCGEPIQLAYCPRCGQSADVDVPTLKAFLDDAASAVFTYDSKFWRTLKPLVTKPGFLSVEYVEGRRVPYVNPMALYFWMQAICFLGFKLTYQNGNLSETRAKVILLSTLASAIFLTILYIPKRRKFAECLVFSLHFNTFLLLILTVIYPVVPLVVAQLVKFNMIAPINEVGQITTKAAIVIMVPYLVFAMRRFFREAWIWTILKVIALYYAYFFCFALISKLLHDGK
jgi:Protein of unknown function (DUF3667)